MKISCDEILCEDNRNYDKKTITELAENIGALGLLNPVTLQRIEDGKYRFKVIAGRRRFRALMLLERRELRDDEFRIISADADMVAFSENFHRQQLSVQEELEQLQLLTGKYGDDKVAFLAKELGKSEVFVRSRLRLLNLSDRWKKILDGGTVPLAYLEEVGKYSKEQQEEIPEYTVHGRKNAREVAEAIRNYLWVKLPKKHWPECDSCPKNPATDTFFFADCPASCTDRMCLIRKLGDDLETILNVFKEKKMPVYLCSELNSFEQREYIEKRFGCKFIYGFQENPKKDNIIIIRDAVISSTKGAVYDHQRECVLSGKSESPKENPKGASLEEQLEAHTNKLNGKRYAVAICALMKFLEDTDAAAEILLKRFYDKEMQIRCLILKYGHTSTFREWDNPPLEDMEKDVIDTVYFSKILKGTIAKIHDRFRCLHRDCSQVDLSGRKKDIERWAADIGIDFYSEYLEKAIAANPETNKMIELKSKIEAAKTEK
jgi:ParB/RepB/Spo0J family partition protein